MDDIYSLRKRSTYYVVDPGDSHDNCNPARDFKPKVVVVALLQRMREVSQSDTLITMDTVLPLSIDGHVEIPAYQSYACLAWLRSVGALEQHGRRGYSLTTTSEIEDLKVIEKGWSELPVHRS